MFNSELRESHHGIKLQHLNLLTKLGIMKTSLRRLHPKDFDAVLLEEWTRQGRVYIDMPQVKNTNAWKREVLDYVRAIRDFATEMWTEDIDQVWQMIVDAECFNECLVMKRGLHAGHMNRYVVTNLVCRMQNMGVYRKDVSMLTLHLQLEGTNKKNKFYTSSGNYYIGGEAKALLKKLFSGV